MGNINNKQMLCIASLLSGCTNAQAAKAASVSAQTLCRWLRDVDFVQELARQRGDLSARIQARVMDRAISAIDVLHDMTASAEKDGDRIRAAGILLGHAVGSIADSEREGRFAQLQATVDAALRDWAQGMP